MQAEISVAFIKYNMTTEYRSISEIRHTTICRDATFPTFVGIPTF